MDARLTTLLAVNDKRNFTRAAATLAMTQPAVSHHINSLERELGIKIFVRKKGDLRLTPEGDIVVKYARRIKGLHEKMRQELTAEERRLTKIKVGITHTAESNMVAEALAQYGGRTEGTSVTILTDTIKNLYDMIVNYDIDLAIVEGRVNDPEINSVLLDTDYLVCVVSNNNALAAKSMVTLNDIKREKMILRLPSSGTQNLFTAHLESINMSIDELNIILEVDNIATIKDLIRKDIGVSVLARSACLDELRKGKITALPIENLSMIRETNIIYRKDFTYFHALREITKIYQEAMKLYT